MLELSLPILSREENNLHDPAPPEVAILILPQEEQPAFSDWLNWVDWTGDVLQDP